MKEGFSRTAAFRIFQRTNGNCANKKCGNSYQTEIHHVFFRSQYYGKDRHDAWNGANICRDCHDSIHHIGNRSGKELDLALKKEALRRYLGTRTEYLEGYVKRLTLKLYGSKNKESNRWIEKGDEGIRRSLPSEQEHYF